MSGRRGRWVAVSVTVVSLLLCCGFAGVVAIASLFSDSSTTATDLASCGGKLVDYDNLPDVPGYSKLQLSRAYAILKEGDTLNVPVRGWVVAIATALQESGLRVYANDNPAYPLVAEHSMALPHDAVGHDHDSVGLFQQRPSPPEGAGSWGTVKQLMDPPTSAKKFYGALRAIPGWQQMPVTVAAQDVQHSAFPDAYAKWEDDATTIVNALANGAARSAITAAAPPTTSACANAAVPAASGWIAPAKGPITSPFGARPGGFHYGTDIGAPRGSTIVAASAGLVITAKCDPATGDCDHDGSINTPGCGWYVEIKHADGVETRYCHMQTRPLVHVGEVVKVGQPIGHVGASGNVTGPHLHFEVHLNDDLSSAGAIDPVPFMRDKGAPLGRS